MIRIRKMLERRISMELAEVVAQWFSDNLHLSKDAIVFIISMIPILELRGGLIVAKFFEINLWKAIGLCIVGNIIPVPFILKFITPIFTWLKKTKRFSPMVHRLEKKSMGKSEKIQKYEFWGLMLFVGIPLPGTGAWTGSLIAALLNMKFSKAFIAVICGIIMATIIMSIFSYGLLGQVL